MLAKCFFSLAVFLVGACALGIPSGYSVGFYLLCFAGLGLWVKHRGSLVSYEMRYFFLPLVAYAIGHMTLALCEKWAMREFSNYLPFLLAIFGVWGIRRYKPKADWFWVGLALGAISAAVLSGYQAMALSMRAGGHTNPIQFGNVALLFGVLCVVRLLSCYQGRGMCALMCIGFVAGFAASAWSQTRGGWVALILIFVWIFVNTPKSRKLFKHAALVLGMLSVFTFLTLQPNSVLQSRIKGAVNEFNAFVDHGQQDNSVGVRLAMWLVAINKIRDAPVFGHGNQGWIEVRDAAIADGRLPSSSSGFTHLHNDYLNVTFKRGLVGLALYLVLCLVPMLMFFKPYLHDVCPDVRAFAMAGMVIPMMFMDFGLTQTFLSHNSGRVVLCSLWMCVAGLMLNAAEDN